MILLQKPAWQVSVATPLRCAKLGQCGGICLLVIVSVAILTGCRDTSKEKHPNNEKPAVVEKLPVETELATVRLTEKANERLGIVTTAIEEQIVSKRRTLGGEAMAPLGNSLIVSAPVPGIIAQYGASPIPLPGAQVGRNQVVVDLVPLLSPERDVMTPAERVQLVSARANVVAAQQTAIGDLERSHAEVEAAKITLSRAEKLFNDGAGARKAVDDAIAQLNIAQSNYQAAQQQEKQLANMLQQLNPSADSSAASPLQLAAPIEGVVRSVNVRVGQTVAVGTPLFEVINLDTIWIRVPVFVDLLGTIDKGKPALLKTLGGQSLPDSLAGTMIEAKPISAPPSADPLSSSADLYYEISNVNLGLRPGQLVGMDLPLVGQAESLVVPASAILYDVYGGTWVYAVTGEREYTRRRVVVRWVDVDQAILASGPSPGTKVVTTGAAELFGTEFGTGK
ncbi:efflux RND transporter periplasmic adaptor subunit [Aeoliella mucimassa]|uniref:Copper/silver efflux system membrane fusion protein CusB n=1 Tax=Aeoliella mucimassa TaxID=2527972 RepID=A0A518AN65_9BACT|nr:efflux RND transporter periplasmic adaptor subunit [Aeoliella mucimassa]QDU56141.1 copper/silver efflux system membrane fusion protein CusB [Aeoliella mucimassa]